MGQRITESIPLRARARVRRLFLIGSAWFEPETRLFRATAMDVPEYPGDTPCDEEPEPAAEVCLTYDPAGGMINVDTAPYVIKLHAGDVVTILAAPTREGYIFLYWMDANGKYYPGDKYTVEGDHTFTAVWKKKSDEDDPGKKDDDDRPGKKDGAPGPRKDGAFFRETYTSGS